MAHPLKLPPRINAESPGLLVMSNWKVTSTGVAAAMHVPSVSQEPKQNIKVVS